MFKYKLTNEGKDFDSCRGLYFKSSKIIRRRVILVYCCEITTEIQIGKSFKCGLLQISMNAMRMLKTTAAICVSIVQEVTTASVQMDSKCLKTTRLVNVQKVSRSPITEPFVWVSSIYFSPGVSNFRFIRPEKSLLLMAVKWYFTRIKNDFKTFEKMRHTSVS